MNLGLLTRDQVLQQDPNAFKRARKEIEREAWLASRRGRITASGVSKLFTSSLAIADNKTAYQYICERMSEREGATIPKTSSNAIRWGNEYEPYAIIAYMEETGYTVTKWGDGEVYEANEKQYQSDGQEFLMLGEYEGATPDGLVLSHHKGVEVKCPENPGIHKMYCLMANWEDLKKIRPDYYAQIQHQMRIVSKRLDPLVKSWDFVSYDPRNEKQSLRIMEVPWDEEFQQLLEHTIQGKIEFMRGTHLRK